MSIKTTYKCDVCHKAITGSHQQHYKAKVVVTHRERDAGGETEDYTKTYHVHNDLTNHCMRKIWNILEAQNAKY